jgi:DNA-binding CsgD family transcriptional regulator
MKPALARIHDAALMPDLWPATLRALASELGAVGAAYMLWNKRTSQIEWVSFAGPILEMKAEFVAHYAAIDAYRSVLNVAPTSRWIRLGECLSPEFLARDEWYNDFLLRSRVQDVVGLRLVDTGSYATGFSLHYDDKKSAPPSRPKSEMMTALVEPLTNAAMLHLSSRSLGWKSAAALRVLDLLHFGYLLVEGDGRVVEVSRAAERFVSKDDGLVIREGRLVALRAFESAKLAKFVAAAAAATPGEAASGHMLIARPGEDRLAFVVKVTPLSDALAWHDRPLAMVLVVDPELKFPSEARIGEVFGLSPAESRVAAALLRGRTLAEIGAQTGVQLTTLRTQLSSVLRKVGVKRQQDLVSTLSAIRLIDSQEW